jgi:hypothetical protein
VYISKPVDVAIYLSKRSREQLAAIKSINLVFHGSPYDAQGKPIEKDDEDMASKAESIEVLGSRLSVKAADVAEMVNVTRDPTQAEHQASRVKYAAYWELRDAMVLLWYATEAQRAPFYLYGCNVARIEGFKELFRGFDRPVFGSTDITGPPPHNWRVEWESELGAVSAAEAVHAEAEVFDRPGAMRLELAGVLIDQASHSYGTVLRFMATGTLYWVAAVRSFYGNGPETWGLALAGRTEITEWFFKSDMERMCKFFDGWTVLSRPIAPGRTANYQKPGEDGNSSKPCQIIRVVSVDQSGNRTYRIRLQYATVDRSDLMVYV